MNKHQHILKSIAQPYLPELKITRTGILTAWHYYNVEHIVEQAMARVGGYECVNEYHYDNSDYSDTKTASINQTDRMATVANVVTAAGEPKMGDLRVVLYNAYKDRLDYFFLPKAAWESMREYGGANCRKLRARYEPSRDIVYKWNAYRLPTFEALAKEPSTQLYPNQYKQAQDLFHTIFST